MSDHPYISQIDAWLTGALTEPETTAFERALLDDHELQLAVAEAEDVLAATWIAMTPQESPSQGLFDRLMTSVSHQPEEVQGFAAKLAELLETTLSHASTLLAKLTDPDEWFPGPGPGTHLVHIDDVPLAQTAIVGFIKIEPGHHFPVHSHVGEEHTFVLQGTLQDGDRLIHKGQHDILDRDTEHLIGAHGDEPVIYLTIADCGIKFGEYFIGPGDPEV